MNDNRAVFHKKCGRATLRYDDGECIPCSVTRKRKVRARAAADAPQRQVLLVDGLRITITIENE